ncbi:rRNA processing [Corchorus capsularis]|uniref:rRNA processing n=1 Tax=Corchorus capsularis TaxID=210143 RepID=A0A1R3I5L5_COCAP|nr:rRNA processing [Corchorus capsularis]
MKNRKANGKGSGDGIEIGGPKPMSMKKNNMKRLGGSGLSLQAFANAKSTSSGYNPALIKQRREFYKNAKYVKKYKRSLKQQSQGNDAPSAIKPPEDENEDADGIRTSKKNKKKKSGSYSLKELYEKQREEKEKERMEREAIIQAKKEQKEKAEAQRKAGKKRMFKRTTHGQPVMKYRIQNLLQSIQSSSGASHSKS